METNKKLIVIVGPTAVGKTALAIQLAKHFQTEIVSADSRQIYRELEIGTAKPSAEELSQIKHHFINSHSIHDDYNAGTYGRDALVLINSLFERYNNLILCGGSGLYVRAVLEGFDEMPPVPEGIREQINKEYEANGLAWLQAQVKQVDPEYFEEVDIQNPHRLIRALELNRAWQKPMHELRKKKKLKHSFQVIKIGIELNREDIYKRIDARMDDMIASGLFEEAEKFYPLRNLNALQTVGYREIFGFMDNLYNKEEAIRLLKRNSRHYAKRQLTWFRKDQEIVWFDGSKPGKIEAFINAVKL
ncbi:MAG TPA: tRNA (adenosine(37)-N6)-dimethylallyltransferase MiaA [Cyclobacteriaceae bacterium]|jgi:tRNA dimethylallyltransferase|nr:tRNA (adenosine(37)-N6)-dimethylallyltransferase MiaA [Cytophagales bacterium]HMR55961.1 tRNA (adenosine(37)-N6)-dimethylallyltransferase MiaA [Cyclobacteriaceae bacterium]HRE68317.1 tRNA (adenosine(37)-N6)-dimethylallyltransferase MiaA [Cyclobacteriaceae bacterium]HRF34897.1 tRNA (adenosine(37)-N6)-dimethylallyltransferase MiaA [Cyclobacteriaceae bacterium]